MTADIHIELNDTTPGDLAEALGRECAGDPCWMRDGILEDQVSTQEEFQYCFRNEPGGDRPRVALCIAGNRETLTVATVVPIERGIEFNRETYSEIVAEFFGEILSGAIAGLEVTATLDQKKTG